MNKASTVRIYRPTPRNLALLASRLQAGEVVAMPTETVYGLAGNALDARACAKIFRAKRRPTADPLIVHVNAVADVEQVAHLNAAALQLAKKFWPGPLTLVLPKKPSVPALVTAGRDSVAVRMPAHPVARRLLKLAAVPLAAPSANPFGYVSPTTAEHVRQGLGRRIKYIVDGGPSQIGLESTIVDLRQPETPVLLRPGAITQAQLESVLGRPVKLHQRREAKPAAKGAGQLAPGLLARHYSPRTPVVLHASLHGANHDTPKEAFVFMAKPTRAPRANVFWFDQRGNLKGVAHRLFAILRKLDGMNFKTIHVELAPGGGLAEAINDRLHRAAAR